MNASVHFLKIWLLLLLLTSCTNLSSSAETPPSTQTPIPAQNVQPTDLAFADPLLVLLNESGLSVLSVQSSVYMSLFQSTNKAVWIKTDEGIVEAVFFDDPREAEQIQVSQLPSETGRYLYKIQAPGRTLSHDVTLDAAFPLYFRVGDSLFMVTSSEELARTLKHIFQ